MNVTVLLKHTPNGIFTSSPDVKGLVIGETTIDGLRRKLPEAISLLMPSAKSVVEVAHDDVAIRYEVN